jgi:hypothetical protein
MTWQELYISEVTIPGTHEVILWHVRGVENVWYPTKIAAESCARVRFPDEDVETRYARVFYKEFVWKETMS